MVTHLHTLCCTCNILTMNKQLRLFLLLGVVCAVPARSDVVCGASQYIPNPGDCGSFYECSNGVPILIKCSPGLEFSTTSKTCDFPSRAQCGSSGSANPAPPPPANLPNYYCPKFDGFTKYIYPNPSSCSSYYLCNGGSLVQYQCPRGLEFSIKKKECDYPETEKCDLNNLPSFPSHTPVNPVDYYCPEIDGPTPYIYPNPFSCSSYYMCTRGHIRYYQCPSGQEYSIEKRACDHSETANCYRANLLSFNSGPKTAADNGPVTTNY